MPDTAPDAAYRQPAEPYPGLRPFLDHESALLQGRARQVQEIIERLQRTQFVAVLGGSGSGKSSVVRAGVVPRLRGSGIREAGDYWIPIVCTPGTSLPTEGAARAPSPVDRLAFKLSSRLQRLEDEAEEQDRRDEIAAVFRQGAGFSRLVDGYHDELPAQGPATEKARFLFVIDQFEELFHPNNRDNDDARCMVEAVIAHFFNPHPRCYLVATMRSEHLADCAAYLELPDAINRSLYMVRRLDERELRDAIVGPAQVFLRLRRRAGTDAGRALPAAVDFAPEVVERLVRDATRIADDPDHLPLLQHVLARCWASACRREGVTGQGVPAAVVWADLEAAAWPALEADGPQPPEPLADPRKVNVLRSSLNRCAQAEYERRDAADRRVLDRLFDQLAYRDPNNGLYFQQRFRLDGMDLFEGETDPLQRLHDLLEHGYLDGVHYLFWDREDPRQVTLKVSHESFIRGWEHFRARVDAQAERFDEFLSVLRKCAAWLPQRDPTLLLEGSDLMRLEGFALDAALTDDRARADWFRTLQHFRGGDRLAATEDSVAEYIEASQRWRQQLAEQDRAREEGLARAQRESELAELRAKESDAHSRQLRRSLNRTYLGAGLAVVATLVALHYWWSVEQLASDVRMLAIAQEERLKVQKPALEGAKLFSVARLLRDRSESAAQPGLGASAQQLGQLLRAADKVFDAKAKGVELNALQPGADDGAQLAIATFALASTEPAVNGNLRRLLTSAIWRNGKAVDGEPPNEGTIAPLFDQGIRCTVDALSAGGARQSVVGTVFVDQGRYQQGQRMLLVSRGEREFDETRFHRVLSPGEQGRPCVVKPAFWSVPNHIVPRMLIDARVRYLVLAAGSAVTLYEIRWTQGGDGELDNAEMVQRSVIPDPEALRIVDVQLGRPDGGQWIAGVPTWREPAGYGFEAAGYRWRLFNEDLQWESGTLVKVDGRPRADDIDHWEEMKIEPATPQAPDAAGFAGGGAGACDELLEALPKQDGFTDRMLPFDDRCLLVKRGNPGVKRGNPDAPAAPDREQVLIALYDPAHQRALAGEVEAASSAPPAIAALLAAERRPAAGSCTPRDAKVWACPRPADRWFRGRSGSPREGWIAVWNANDGSYASTPLSTEALFALGCQAHRRSVEAGRASEDAPARCNRP